MPNLGTTELVIILVIVIIIFGAGKLGSVGSALGRGVSDFRSAVKEDDKENSDKDDAARPAKASAEKKEDSVEAESSND